MFTIGHDITVSQLPGNVDITDVTYFENERCFWSMMIDQNFPFN